MDEVVDARHHIKAIRHEKWSWRKAEVEAEINECKLGRD